MVENSRTLYSVEEHIATVTINHPPTNPLTHKDITELGELITEADKDDNVRVIVLTGAGDQAFSSGGDIKVLFKGVLNAQSKIQWKNGGLLGL